MSQTRGWNPLGLEAGAVILGDGVISNLDFHRDGRYLVMATRESSLHLIDCLSSNPKTIEKKKLYCRSHGIAEVKFTHNESCVLMTC